MKNMRTKIGLGVLALVILIGFIAYYKNTVADKYLEIGPYAKIEMRRGLTVLKLSSQAPDLQEKFETIDAKGKSLTEVLDQIGPILLDETPIKDEWTILTTNEDKENDLIIPLATEKLDKIGIRKGVLMIQRSDKLNEKSGYDILIDRISENERIPKQELEGKSLKEITLLLLAKEVQISKYLESSLPGQPRGNTIPLDGKMQDPKPDMSVPSPVKEMEESDK